MSVSALFGNPKPQFFVSGIPAVGYRLFFYAANTSTKQNTFTDSSAATTNTNAIVLDAEGYPTGNVMIYGTDNLAYKVVMAPPGSDDPPTSPTWTIDQIFTTASGLVQTATTVVNFTATAGQTLFSMPAGTSYGLGNNSLQVFLGSGTAGGQLLLTKDVDYTETSTSSFTLAYSAVAGDNLTAIIGQTLASLSTIGGSSVVLTSGDNLQTYIANRVINIKDAPYSAVGDGVTDDTAAIAAALLASQTVYFPAGTYLISTALALSSFHYIFGDGRSNTIIQTSVTTINAFEIAADARKGVIKDLSINSGAGVGTTNTAIKSNATTGFAEWVLSNLQISSYKYGLTYATTCWNNKFTHIRMDSCDYGIYTTDTAGTSINNLFEHVYIEGSLTTAIYNANATNYVTYDSCNFGISASSALPFMQFVSTTRATLINCHFEGHAGITANRGCVEVSGASYVNFIGCSWQSNVGASATGYELRLSSSCIVNVFGCSVQSEGANMAHVRLENTSKLNCLDNSFTTITHASGSTATTQVSRASKAFQVISDALDLSGAAQDTVILNLPAGVTGRVTRIAWLYTEATSADAGITVTVKSATGTTFFSGTSSISTSQWTVEEKTLSRTAIDASSTLIFDTAGGKVGAGAISCILEYVLDI